MKNSDQPTINALAIQAEAARERLVMQEDRYHYALAENHDDLDRAERALDRARKRSQEADAALDAAIQRKRAAAV